jgi:putative flippase GtrA
MRNWMRFNAVGLAGMAVQLAALKLMRDGIGMHYLLATGLAVELAVLHNFCWHWKWTWRERSVSPSRLLHFQCTTGLVSIAGNLFGMSLLTGLLGIPLIPANLLSIAFTHVFNFVVADRYVFRLR